MERRNLCGVLLLDKAFGHSSNTVLLRTKILFNAVKAGHTGTLDPFATGLLPICFGEATKFAGYMLDATKAYDATIKLGWTSTTGDADGDLVFQHAFSGDGSEIETVLQNFRGHISQTPPMHSAIKLNGKPLYKMARAGIEIERAARELTIYELTLLARRDDELDIRVVCSKGTYIRVLAQDIGAALGCGGYLAALRRTGTGGYRLEQAHKFEALQSMSGAAREAVLLPVDTLLQDLPATTIGDEEARHLTQGKIVQRKEKINNSLLSRVYVEDGRFYGLANFEPDGRIVASRMMGPQTLQE